jgi:hypothetical protein
MLDINIPEWVDAQAKPIEGLDLLGLRLPVQTISGSLFNGITTITPRIRIISIRAWMIKAYSESGLPDSSDALEEFVARVETAISLAILSVDNKALYIPGATLALKVLNEPVDPVPLQKLLGQSGFSAYTGPSDDLLVSFPRETGVPGLSKERGEPLANFFESLIQDTEFYRLLKANPYIAEVSRNVLTELGNAIRIDSIQDEELTLLLNTLIPIKPHDKATVKESSRISFYTLLLELAQRMKRLPSEDDVFIASLKAISDLPNSLSMILDGFLLYRIRDALAVLHEAALDLVCSELNSRETASHEHDVVGTLVAEMLDIGLQKIGLIAAGESAGELTWSEFGNRVESHIAGEVSVSGLLRWDSIIDENQIVTATVARKENCVGLLPVAWYLCRKRAEDQDYEKYPHLELLFRNGGARIGLKHVVLPELQKWDDSDPLLQDVVGWLIKRSVDQHLRIAWSRMFTEMDRDVSVLLTDGNMWMFRKVFYGGRTDSRIRVAIGWLRQLGLVGKSGITDKGMDALQRGYHALASIGGEA